MFQAISAFTSTFYGVAVLLFAAFCIACVEVKSRQLSIVNNLTIIFFLSVLFGTRTIRTGTDTLAYDSWYKSLAYSFPERDFEPLFTYLGRLIHSITTDSAIFFLIISFISIILIAISSREISGLVFAPLAVILSVSFVSGSDLLINGIRNGLALSLATYAFAKYCNGLRFHYYLLIIAAATLIHASCVIFIMLPLLMYMTKNRSLYLIFAIYIFIFMMESNGVFNSIFERLRDAGIGGHLVSRVIAFKYQEEDLLTGSAKYYFFAISIIPMAMKILRFSANEYLSKAHYILLMPYAFIFSASSSYRFSYISFFILALIITDAVSKERSFTKRVLVYFSIAAMIILTYSTRTSMSYENIIFN